MASGLSAAPKRATGFARIYGPALGARWLEPERRFVILTVGRSGSELLVSLLDAHPDIVCEGELLDAELNFPWAYVRARAAKAGLRGAKAFGWKLLFRQFRTHDDVARLYSSGYRIVVLERRDLMKQAISAVLAQDPVHHYRKGEGHVFEAAPIDPVAVVAAAALIEGAAEKIRETMKTVPHFRLVYEDDLLDSDRQQSSIDRICEFLDLPSAPVGTDLVKITPRRTQDLVANFDEVHELFARTRLASYLPVGDRQ